MRPSVFAVTCSLAVALSSGLIFAQSSSDAAISEPDNGTTRPAMKAQNRQLSKAVRHALTSKKGVVSSNIAVLAKGGVVSLVGTVPDAAQIPVAGEVARRVPNVQSVDNRLVVEEEGN